MPLQAHRICRFCGNTAPLALLVRLGNLRYGHARCALEAIGAGVLLKLEPTELAKIPIGIARQYHLLHKIEQRLAGVGL